jgi:ketosteroid isomerase-like protein
MDAYGTAWVENDENRARSLFAENARYYVSPFKPPWVGRDEIAAMWISDPEGQEDVTFEHTPLAAEGDTGIARWKVTYTRTSNGRARMEMDGVLVLEFDDDGRCVEHREWFFRREAPV